MKSFYTNVQVYGAKILYRGIKNGRKVRDRIDYHPTLFVSSNKPTKFTTVMGEYVSEINPGTIRDCRDFVKQYEDVDGFKIYGNQKYEYTFISDEHPHEVDWTLITSMSAISISKWVPKTVSQSQIVQMNLSQPSP